MKGLYPIKGYVFISVQKSESAGQSPHFLAIKTNTDLKVVSSISCGSEEEREILQSFGSWLGNPNEYKFIAYSHEDFTAFVQRLDKEAGNLPRDFIRILRSRFWNIRSEVAYKLKCPPGFSIKQLLEMYGLSEDSSNSPLNSHFIELHNLTNAYLFDKERTKEIQEKGYRFTLERHYQRLSTEQLIESLVKDGFLLTIEPLKDNHIQLLVRKLMIHEPDGRAIERKVEGTSLQKMLIDTVLHFYENA